MYCIEMYVALKKTHCSLNTKIPKYVSRKVMATLKAISVSAGVMETETQLLPQNVT